MHIMRSPGRASTEFANSNRHPVTVHVTGIEGNTQRRTVRLCPYGANDDFATLPLAWRIDSVTHHR